MAGRFSLYTDADIRGAVIHALRARGWDVVRAVDAFPEGTDDDVHFEEAVRLGRVLVSNDDDQLLLALECVEQGRNFPGLVTWSQGLYVRMTAGEMLDAFEDLATRDDPFGAYPIIYLKPKR